MGSTAAVLLWYDGDEHMALAIGRQRLEMIDQLVAAGGLVSDHKGPSEWQALPSEVNPDVGHWQPGGVLGAVDQIPSQQTWLRGRGSGNDHLVWASRGDRVHRRQERIGVAYFPGGDDALGGQQRHGEIDTYLSGFAYRLVIDHQAGGRLGLRNHEPERHIAFCGTLAHRLQQLLAPE